ncbi:hypothetical protein pipiens_012064 [Culex pipiens pipiens]|uniref:Uncharacterized protein n=1 Tax=Culex pipiens pipiens TaxID=38569 RepID=A0ABD1D3T3_CULPP
MLHVAAQHGLNRSLKLLLEQSIFDVDVGDFDKTTPLQEAACRGHKSCVELLLMAGADVEYVDLQGTNTLTRAFCGSQEEMVQLLLERQVSLDNAREFRLESSELLLMYWTVKVVPRFTMLLRLVRLRQWSVF